MKKMLALIVTVILFVSLQPALAEGLFETAPAYTLTESELAMAGLNGGYTAFEELGLRLWLPEGFTEVPSPVGAQDTGVQMMRVFTAPGYSFTVSVSVLFIDGVDTYEQMSDKWTSEKADAHAAPVIINGCESLLCDAADPDGASEQSQFIIGGSGAWLTISITSVSGETESMLAELIQLSLSPIAF